MNSIDGQFRNKIEISLVLNHKNINFTEIQSKLGYLRGEYAFSFGMSINVLFQALLSSGWSFGGSTNNTHNPATQEFHNVIVSGGNTQGDLAPPLHEARRLFLENNLTHDQKAAIVAQITRDKSRKSFFSDRCLQEPPHCKPRAQQAKHVLELALRLTEPFPYVPQETLVTLWLTTDRTCFFRRDLSFRPRLSRTQPAPGSRRRMP